MDAHFHALAGPNGIHGPLAVTVALAVAEVCDVPVYVADIDSRGSLKVGGYGKSVDFGDTADRNVLEAVLADVGIGVVGIYTRVADTDGEGELPVVERLEPADRIIGVLAALTGVGLYEEPNVQM